MRMVMVGQGWGVGVTGKGEVVRLVMEIWKKAEAECFCMRRRNYKDETSIEIIGALARRKTELPWYVNCMVKVS